MKIYYKSIYIGKLLLYAVRIIFANSWQFNSSKVQVARKVIMAIYQNN